MSNILPVAQGTDTSMADSRSSGSAGSNPAARIHRKEDLGVKYRAQLFPGRFLKLAGCL
jgi:hypothetical protein